MATVPIRPSATITNGRLVLASFTEDDPAVLGVLTEAADLETGVHRLLQVGARSVVAAGGRLDELTVERSFARMSDHMDGALSHTVEKVSQLTDDLLDQEDGTIARLFADAKSGIEGLLQETFDPHSRESALGRLQQIFDDAVARHHRDLRSSLDPDDNDTPLGRWRSQVVRELQSSTEIIRKDLADLSTSLAVRQAKQAERERGTAKGVEYEDLVHLVATDIAAHHGDVVEALGRTAGSTGAKTGDHVITINPEDTGGVPARIALEVKNRRLSLPKVLDELDRAMTNREAQSAIAVFATQDQAPVSVPISVFNDRVVTVLDEDSPDERALELAVLVARWIARRKLTFDLDTLDVGAIEALISDARVALERAAAIRRCHSTVRKSVETASAELNALVADVDEALRRLHDQLDR